MARVVNLDAGQARCVNCRLRADCALVDDQSSASTDVGRRVRILHRGDRLFREGAAVDAVYRVRTGIVKTSVMDADGREQVTGFFGPGEWVGLDCLQSATYCNEATALDTTSVCVVARQSLLSLMNTAPRRMCNLLGALGRRVHAQDALHMSLARDTAMERMAAFLLDLSARQVDASLDGDDIALAMSRADIASYLALAVETVSRLLTGMQRDGILKVSRTHVTIVDRDALAALARPGPRRQDSTQGMTLPA